MQMVKNIIKNTAVAVLFIILISSCRSLENKNQNETDIDKLYNAIRKENLEEVKSLVENDKNILDYDHYSDEYKDDLQDKTPLMIAAERYNYKIAKLLIEHEVNVNEKNKDGETALMYACKNYNGLRGLGLIQLLLDKGASINEESSYGSTPLFYAANNERLVGFLIDKGAVISHRNKEGEVPQMCSGINKLITLLYYGAKADIYDINERSALFYASINDDPIRCEVLLKYGADPNHLDKSGSSPFTSAVSTGKIAVTRVMLKYGGNPNAINKVWKRSVLENAAGLGYPQITKMLLEAGADVNKVTKNNQTILDYVIYLYNLEKSKPNKDEPYCQVEDSFESGEWGSCSFSLAPTDTCDYPEVIKYLREHGAKTAKELEKEAAK